MRPLEGVRIADLSWLMAGAGGLKLMSALGAEVIRVEWHGRMDWLRFHAQTPIPYRQPDHAPLDPQNPNRSGYFNAINAGKYGISLNVKHPEGRKLFLRLVGISDVVVESFTAETMDKLGLGYEVLKSVKPDIIYYQQPGWGKKGPYVKYASYGPIAQGISGLTEQSGLPDPNPPAGWGFSYMDWSGAYYCAIGMLLALNYKQATGKGQYIDGSQIEPAIYMTATAILDYVANGRHWQRSGNRSRYQPAAPHGAYRCAGPGADRWIAIAARNEDEWRGLVKEMGQPGWSADPKFATMAARIANQDELDRLMEAWTREHDGYALQERLQKAGVPAGVCQRAQDRLELDPQLKHLKWMIDLPHSYVGTWPHRDIAWHFANLESDQGGPTRRSAPCYGEDNDYVYGELLKLSKAEQDRLRRDGVI
jgi:crotonobetainyl-CoA:carnitine CoA-transferase CaiB-like acyl-CoA transferase